MIMLSNEELRERTIRILCNGGKNLLETASGDGYAGFWGPDLARRDAKKYGMAFGEGATRFVLIPEGEDFVIKFDRFSVGPSFNLREFEFYSNCPEIWKECFAETRCIGDITVEDSTFFNVCVSEKCVCDAEDLGNSSANFLRQRYASDLNISLEELDKNLQECDRVDCERNTPVGLTEAEMYLYQSIEEEIAACEDTYNMVAFACDVWGLPYGEFIDFVTSILDNPDLHSGNWGYTNKGRLVIVDYAGFN